MVFSRIRSEPASSEPTAITTPLIIVSVVFPVLSSVSILLRHWVQRKNPRWFFPEDGWLWFSWLTCLALSTVVWVYARSGIDHYRVSTLDGTQDSLRMVWLCGCVVQVPLTAVKIAILLFYKRVFSIKTRAFAICVWVTIAAVAVWGILFFLLILVEIDPISLVDMLTVKLRFDTTSMSIAQVSTSIALDVVVLCFPLPIISKLHIGKSRKWALAVIFWLGIFCVIAAVVRLYFFTQYLAQVDANFSLVYLHEQVIIFEVMEPNVSIIAACLPLFRPLITDLDLRGCIARCVHSLRSVRRSKESPKSVQLQQESSSAAELQAEHNAYARLAELQDTDGVGNASQRSIALAREQTLPDQYRQSSAV